MDNLILIEKATKILKSKYSEDDKETASILIAKCVEHSVFDIKDFVGDKEPYNEITFDGDASKVIACNKLSMVVLKPALKVKKDKKPAFPYSKVIPDVSKNKVLELIDNVKLLSEITNAKIEEIIGNKTFINIAKKGELRMSIDNAIKLFQFGIDGWKQGSNKALVKTKENKTIVLMPAILK